VVIDETLERRWGPQIRKRGHDRESALSSHEHAVSSPGLRWIVLAVVVTLPWTQPRWALPLLCTLASTADVSAQLGIRHKTVGMRTHQRGSLLRRGLPAVPLMGDMAYSILELGLHCAKQQITLLAPFRLDSVLHQPAPARRRPTSGRPRDVLATSSRGGPTTAFARTYPARSADRVAASHPRLVGRRPTDASVREPPAGSAWGRLPCRCAGCSPATRREPAGTGGNRREHDRRKPCLLPTQPSQQRRWLLTS
jgi:hypothetical protein